MMRVAICLVVSVLACGCSVFKAGKEMTQESARSLRPSARDYRDDVNDERQQDVWSSVGVQARGGQPVDHESDGLTRFTQSAKARSINRSLGVE